MRAILFILIIAIVAVIGAIATGFLDIRQTRPAEIPDVDATQKGVRVQGGQAPAFDVETGTVAVGTGAANVTVPVPKVEVRPPEQNQSAGGNQAR